MDELNPVTVVREYIRCQKQSIETDYQETEDVDMLVLYPLNADDPDDLPDGTEINPDFVEALQLRVVSLIDYCVAAERERLIHLIQKTMGDDDLDCAMDTVNIGIDKEWFAPRRAAFQQVLEWLGAEGATTADYQEKDEGDGPAQD